MPKPTLIDCCIKKYAYREVSQIYQELGVSQEGLSSEQVEIMREKYGINRFPGQKNDTMLRRLRRAFINPDRKSTRLNSSHQVQSRMPSSA